MRETPRSWALTQADGLGHEAVNTLNEFLQCRSSRLLLPALHAVYDKIAHAAAIIVDIGLAPAALHRELDAAVEAPVDRRGSLAKSRCPILQLLLRLLGLLLLGNARDCYCEGRTKGGRTGCKDQSHDIVPQWGLPEEGRQPAPGGDLFERSQTMRSRACSYRNRSARSKQMLDGTVHGPEPAAVLR